LVGSAVFLAAGLILSVAGVWQDRPGRLRGGVALSASALLAAVAGKFETDWHGSRQVPLAVRVVDASTGRPIANASVRLFSQDHRDGSASKTDASGFAQVTHWF